MTRVVWSWQTLDSRDSCLTSCSWRAMCLQGRQVCSRWRRKLSLCGIGRLKSCLDAVSIRSLLMSGLSAASSLNSWTMDDPWCLVKMKSTSFWKYAKWLASLPRGGSGLTSLTLRTHPICKRCRIIDITTCPTYSSRTLSRAKTCSRNYFAGILRSASQYMRCFCTPFSPRSLTLVLRKA